MGHLGKHQGRNAEIIAGEAQGGKGQEPAGQAGPNHGPYHGKPYRDPFQRQQGRYIGPQAEKCNVAEIVKAGKPQFQVQGLGKQGIDQGDDHDVIQIIHGQRTPPLMPKIPVGLTSSMAKITAKEIKSL